MTSHLSSKMGTPRPRRGFVGRRPSCLPSPLRRPSPMPWLRRFVETGSSGANVGVSATNATRRLAQPTSRGGLARGFRDGRRSRWRRPWRHRLRRRWRRTSTQRSGSRQARQRKDRRASSRCQTRSRARAHHRACVSWRRARSTAASPRSSGRRGVLSPFRTRS